MIEFTKGNMFLVGADFLVNTVNCNGVMGKGVALKFRHRYPEMFKEYRNYCKNNGMFPGDAVVHHHVTEDNKHIYICNVATKKDWWKNSTYRYVARCLDNLYDKLSTHVYKNVIVALPALGCGKGGLDWNLVKDMIQERLSELPQQIYVFEPNVD